MKIWRAKDKRNGFKFLESNFVKKPQQRVAPGTGRYQLEERQPDGSYEPVGERFDIKCFGTVDGVHIKCTDPAHKKEE